MDCLTYSTIDFFALKTTAIAILIVVSFILGGVAALFFRCLYIGGYEVYNEIRGDLRSLRGNIKQDTKQNKKKAEPVSDLVPDFISAQAGENKNKNEEYKK